MAYYVYLLANATNVALYTGVTHDLRRQVWEHREHLDPNGFTARYHITKLVERKNPAWADLYPQIIE